VSYFSAVIGRHGKGWRALDVDVEDVESIDELADHMRTASHDEGPVLAVIEREDSWFALLRVDAGSDDDCRAFVSDLPATEASRFADLLAPVGDAAGQSPLVKGLLLVILTTIVGLVVGRIAHALYARRDRGARGWRGGLAPARSRGGRDPWVIAQEAAARGDFTAAAHALYQALLEAVARRGEVRLHESKTLGDYVRELRARSSALFGRFRDFARAYEVVIYGIGVCDRERFERLRALALPVIRPDAR
jgi:hypothetical protein